MCEQCKPFNESTRNQILHNYLMCGFGYHDAYVNAFNSLLFSNKTDSELRRVV